MFDILPQQRLMVDHLLAHPAVALFVDAGLGKTRAVIEAMSYLFSNGDIKGVLVVAPLRVALLTWPNELAKWQPWMKVADLRTAEGKALWKTGGAHVYLINYEMLPKISEMKGEWPVDVFVFDEVHYAKNPSSKRVKGFLKHTEKFKRRIGMTGTPISNSYIDLFAPIRLLDGGERLGKTFTAYRERYFDSDWNGWNFTVKPWAREAITERISDIVLTLKGEDFLDIPQTSTVDVDVPLSADDMRRYRQLQKDYLLKLDNDKELVGVNAAALIGKLTQMTSGACYDEERNVVHIHWEKIKALQQLVKDVNEPTVVVTMYQHERRRILERVAGSELFEEGSLDRWNRGGIKVLVVDPRSVGAGLNMQDGGRRIVWYTQTYSHTQYTQMNARLIRTGQERETFVYRLLCPQTVDWAIVEALRVKGEEQDGLKEALHNLRRII